VDRLQSNSSIDVDNYYNVIPKAVTAVWHHFVLRSVIHDRRIVDYENVYKGTTFHAILNHIATSL